jgi:DNA-binding transcriptional LysR family regulator
MELQQIRYFLTLARELHFWNTAEKVFITQSALSRQIKALEVELGVQLFERSKRSVKLTEAGIFLRDQWTPLLEEIDRIHRQARKIHDGASGSIRIAYPGSVAYGFLPELVASIAQVLPELRIELVEPVDISIEESLLGYKIDLALRREDAENPALQSVCLYSENLALVVPENHPLQAQTFTGFEELKDEKFILSALHHNTVYVSLLRQVFREYDFEPNVHIESDFGAMILSLVAKGLGISILPGSYSFSTFAGVRFIKLPHNVSLYATWRKNDTSPVLRNILKQVEALAVKFSTGQL